MTERNQDLIENTEPDFVESRNWRQYLTGRTNLFLIGVVLIVICGAGLMYYRSIQSEKEQEASLALSRISTYFDALDYEKALNGDPLRKVRGSDVIGLISIVDQYASTNAGKTAALLSGIAEVALQKYSEAESYFDIASESASTIIRVDAFAGLAMCKEKMSDYLEAAKLYAKSATIGKNLNSYDKYTCFSAACYEKSGDKEKAKELYRSIIMESEYSEYSGEAKAGLTRLGTLVE